jgi:hypothetical protein
MQFLPAVVNSQPVGGIDHPYQCVRLLKVVPPVRPQRFLPANVPCGSSAAITFENWRYVQILSLYLHLELSFVTLINNCPCYSPLVVNGFNDKPQRRADCIDILAHNLLDNCRFPGIIEPPISCLVNNVARPFVHRGVC